MSQSVAVESSQPEQNDFGQARRILVEYRVTESDRFDKDYWLHQHIPLAKSIWAEHGFLDGDGIVSKIDGGSLALALLTFRDDTSMAGAIAAPDNALLDADVPNFTDLSPKVYALTPLG